MNILFLDGYFFPENIAYSHLEKDLIEGLIEAGHSVSVICPVPTREISPELREKYSKIKHECFYDNKLSITRFWAPQEKKNPLLRALRYLWCNIRTYQQLKKFDDVDVVFSNSTPPTQGIVGVRASKKLSKRHGKKVPFIYNLQDIFPDSLLNAGFTDKNSILWKVGRTLENYIYKYADKIIVISNSFKNNIECKGVPNDKIEIIRNWTDFSKVTPIAREDNILFNELGIDRQKFTVVYAGNFGATQGADIVLKVAKMLQEKSDIQFVIFGGGRYFEEVKKEAERIANICIHELMPIDRISEVYSLGDAALIIGKSGLGEAAMPSKLWNIMACNTPIIASFDTNSEMSDVIRDASAGICVEPEDAEALVDGILKVKNNEICISHNIRDYAMKIASKEMCVEKYVQMISYEVHK